MYSCKDCCYGEVCGYARDNVKENDFLICKPEGENSKEQQPFNVYARVTEINNNNITLDCYQKEGSFHLFQRTRNIEDIEKYYVPMDENEIQKFYKGLRNLTNSSNFKCKSLQERKVIYVTFQAVKEQVKLKPKNIERD